MVLKIKNITIKISIPIKKLQSGKEFTFSVKDDANIVEILALVDKHIHEHPEESVFPLHDGYIHNYLQFLVDFKEKRIYEDVGLFPYAPDENGNLRKFNPIADDLYFNIFPDTVIDLQQDVGCGGEQVKQRVDIGEFKTFIRKKYGKDHETFAHYFNKEVK